MRISSLQMQDRGLAAIMDRQTELSKTQQQVATGKKFLVPSDDVLGATQALALKKVMSTHEQYSENSDVAENRLLQEESSLTQAINGLQRIRELAVQANNDSLNASNRANIAVEIREILSEVVGIANAVDSNGEFLFAGFNVDTSPFTATENPPASGLFDYAYTGDLGQRTVQIGDTRFIAVGDNGQEVFMDTPVSGGGTQNIFETIEQFAVDLEANTINTNILDDMSLAMDHFESFRTKTGARQNAIDSHRFLNEDIIFQSERTMSQVQDLDFAEAVSRLNMQLAGLQASQQSFAKIQNLSLFNYL
jgi:flagellar hook-associated protein 3 FlgL